jgi:hypothetical protein
MAGRRTFRLIMYGSSYMFRHYIAIFRERSQRPPRDAQPRSSRQNTVDGRAVPSDAYNTVEHLLVILHRIRKMLGTTIKTRLIGIALIQYTDNIVESDNMHENGDLYHPAGQCCGWGSQLSACHEAERDSLPGILVDITAVWQLLSAYFRFALSVSFRQCSIFVNLPITDAVWC